MGEAGLGADGCPLRSGSATTLAPRFTLKYAHVSSRPSRAASSPPEVNVRPPEPST